MMHGLGLTQSVGDELELTWREVVLMGAVAGVGELGEEGAVAVDEEHELVEGGARMEVGEVELSKIAFGTVGVVHVLVFIDYSIFRLIDYSVNRLIGDSGIRGFEGIG